MEQFSPQDEQRVFEADVRRVAESLWPAAYGGSAFVDGRERDGVYESDDAVHLIEATVSKKLEKAKQDLSKLVELHRKRKRTTRDRIVKGWWVVRDGLSQEQREEYVAILRRHHLSPADLAAVSFEEFRRKLIDVNEYLGLREKAPFGSIADPLTGETNDKTEYVALDMVDRVSGGRLLYSKPDSSVHRPAFRRCAFESVEGAVGLPDLDGTLFSSDCEFDRFESSVATNTDIRSLPIPLGVRVGLTMLRKLFLQRGHGRRESALLRGLGGKEREIAGRVLQVIRRERVASTLGGKLSEVWLPNRSMRSEVLAALANPHNMDRPLIKELAGVK